MEIPPMSMQLVQATCPKCKRKLKIEEATLESMLRCKFCGQVFRRKGASVTAAAVVAPAPTVASNGHASGVSPTAPTPATPIVETADSEFMARYRERRRKRRKLNLIIAGCVFLALVVLAIVNWGWITGKVTPLAGQIAKAIEEGPQSGNPPPEPKSAPPAPTEIKIPDEPKAIKKPEPPEKAASKTNPDSPLLDDEPITKATKPTRPRTANRSDVRPLRISGYAGRALLVGIKNYVYANPLNPGYRSENSLSHDPLGFKGLRSALVRDFGFANDQIGELSDVAAKNPNPPLKSTIEKTITEFLAGSRPQDHVVLVFMGHAAVATKRDFFFEDTKAYLVPIEADLNDTASMIPLSWVYEQLAKCPARQKLLILDVANFDPEQGMARAGGEAMKPGLMKEIERIPQGVQTWVSCSPGEYSYQFSSNGYRGSVFMELMLAYSDMTVEANRKLLLENPGLKEGTLPLVLMAENINKDVTARVRERTNAVQTPKFFGKEGPAPEKPVDAPAPSVTIAMAAGGEKFADPKFAASIIKELELVTDRSSGINPDALPPFFAKNLVGYDADYRDDEEFQKMLKENPFRGAIIAAARVMKKHDLTFRKDFKYPGDEAKFKKELATRQEEPATIEAELDDAQAQLDKVGKEREKEKSKRWQAHYDFIYARLLAKKTYVREYNFVLGNKLKKDAPVIKDKKNNNGWVVIPTEKMQQKETRDWDKKRQTLLDKLVKEHPGTPWELLAKREKSAFLGLTIQEAKVE
jgi:hypothetical protein